MSKSRFKGLVAVLAIFAFAAMPAVAQATASHWYSRGTELRRGAPPTPINGKGSASIKLLTGSQAGQSVTCTVKYKGEVWNPAPKGAGEDNLNSISFSKCKSTPVARCTIAGLALPWHSALVREYPEEDDSIEAVRLEVSCPSIGSSLIEGGLQGRVGTGVTEQEGLFESGPSAVEAKVEMVLHIQGKGHGLHVGP